jgi:hypothetical protein
VNIRITKNLGRYNLCSNDKDWNVSIRIDGESISATWPQEDEPDVSDASATEVIQLILDRENSYWISTSRARINAQADKWLSSGAEINRAWATQQIAELQRKSADLYQQINRLRNEYLEAA